MKAGFSPRGNLFVDIAQIQVSFPSRQDSYFFLPLTLCRLLSKDNHEYPQTTCLPALPATLRIIRSRASAVDAEQQ
jgi:hypothetical protein